MTAHALPKLPYSVVLGAACITAALSLAPTTGKDSTDIAISMDTLCSDGGTLVVVRISTCCLGPVLRDQTACRGENSLETREVTDILEGFLQTGGVVWKRKGALRRNMRLAKQVIGGGLCDGHLTSESTAGGRKIYTARYDQGRARNSAFRVALNQHAVGRQGDPTSHPRI